MARTLSATNARDRNRKGEVEHDAYSVGLEVRRGGGERLGDLLVLGVHLLGVCLRHLHIGRLVPVLPGVVVVPVVVVPVVVVVVVVIPEVLRVGVVSVARVGVVGRDAVVVVAHLGAARARARAGNMLMERSSQPARERPPRLDMAPVVARRTGKRSSRRRRDAAAPRGRSAPSSPS